MRGLGADSDVIAALEECVKIGFSGSGVTGCTGIEPSLVLTLAPNIKVLNLLATAFAQGPFGPRGAQNQFFGNAEWVDVLRHHASTNPDAAMQILLNTLDQALRDPFTSAPGNNVPGGVFDNMIAGIVENAPRAATDDIRTKARLALTSVGDAATGHVAQIALQGAATIKGIETQIAAARAQQSQQQQAQAASAASAAAAGPSFTLSSRAKTALLVTAAVAAVGGSAFLLWRVSRGPRMQPSYAPAFAEAGRLRRRVEKALQRKADRARDL